MRGGVPGRGVGEGTADERVTERKLAVNKSAWVGAGEEGIVSCQRCSVAPLLHVTCNQTDRVVL